MSGHQCQGHSEVWSHDSILRGGSLYGKARYPLAQLEILRLHDSRRFWSLITFIINNNLGSPLYHLQWKAFERSNNLQLLQKKSQRDDPDSLNVNAKNVSVHLPSASAQVQGVRKTP